MNLDELVNYALKKSNFNTLNDYKNYCIKFLKYIKTELQAVIISQNELNYCFFQYNKDGNYNISRPINKNLMLDLEDVDKLDNIFFPIINNIKDIPSDSNIERLILCKSIYTIQQSIGAILDALPSGKSNNARKINGDLFERLICLLINKAGVKCASGKTKIPITVNGEKPFSMDYQHDLVIYKEDVIRLIGSIKTSSKDRIDKIFFDKYLYSRLTETTTPYIAIFLNDVQRKVTKLENKYGISSTFLPGHFKAYTFKINPLDGVYYCDIRPNMISDEFLKRYIKTIDKFFFDDLKEFIK